MNEKESGNCCILRGLGFRDFGRDFGTIMEHQMDNDMETGVASCYTGICRRGYGVVLRSLDSGRG